MTNISLPTLFFFFIFVIVYQMCWAPGYKDCFMPPSNPKSEVGCSR